MDLLVECVLTVDEEVAESLSAEEACTLETGKPDRLENMHTFTAAALNFLLKAVSK